VFTIRDAQKDELGTMARINNECFPEDNSTLGDALMWVETNWRAFPRASYFVLLNEKGQIGGYILWLERGGFREKAVLELEQIAVTTSWRGQGCAKMLIRDSLSCLKGRLASQGRSLKLVEVTTSKENEAQLLYQSTLGAAPEAVLRDLFGGDEVIMIARNP
jgi:ribosomal protein S18 acetylase RimI-like enzyme